jgi:hypothetical protein
VVKRVVDNPLGDNHQVSCLKVVRFVVNEIVAVSAFYKVNLEKIVVVLRRYDVVVFFRIIKTEKEKRTAFGDFVV